MEDEKVIETTPVEEENAPVETVEEKETETFDDVVGVDVVKGIETLIREAITEIKALSTLITSDTTVQVEDVEDGSNDSKADELEAQLEDLDF